MAHGSGRPAWRHHFVPQFHLRAFRPLQGPRNHIWALDRQTGHAKLHAIKTTAWRKDYYSVQTSGESTPTADLETAIARLEGAAAPLVARLCQFSVGRFRLSMEDRITLGAYFGLLYGRVPAARKPTEDMAYYLANIEADMWLSDREGFLKRVRKSPPGRSLEETDRLRKEWLADLREGRFRFQATQDHSLVSVMSGIDPED